MKLHESISNKCSIKAFSKLAQKFKNKHGNKYDYSKVVYYSSNTPITIICPIHGEFEQTPESHYAGRNCGKCAKEKVVQSQRDSLQTYVVKANNIHNYKYMYFGLSHINKKTRVLYRCEKHGIMLQDAASHIQGYGCKQCGIEARAAMRFKSKEQVIIEFQQIHGNKYDYTNILYKGVKQHITIVCPIHGPFKQTPDNHLQGTGCPGCAVTGFDTTKPGILYYLSINNGQAYKIGITNRSIKQRYVNKDLKNIQVLHQVHYKNGNDAYLEERRIMSKYKQYKYTGPNLLRDGNTELFSCNILNIKE